MKIGYVRVSTDEQSTMRQEIIMKSLGVEKIYIEKCTGTTKDRPELNNMLEFIREGDSVIVESISRFARNTRDLLDLVAYLQENGITFISQKESLDTSTPAGRFMLTIFGAIAELEREYIKLRQLEGIAVAKAQGKYKGRKKILYPRNWSEIYGQWVKREITGTHAMELLGLKRNTFYKLVKEYGEKLSV